MWRVVSLLVLASSCAPPVPIPEECREALQGVDAADGWWPSVTIETGAHYRFVVAGDSLWVTSNGGSMRLNKACPFVVQQLAVDAELLGVDGALAYLARVWNTRSPDVAALARSASDVTPVGALGAPFTNFLRQQLSASALGSTELYFFVSMQPPLFAMTRAEGALRVAWSPAQGSCDALARRGDDVFAGCGTDVLRVDTVRGTATAVFNTRTEKGFFSANDSALFFETDRDGSTHLVTMGADGTTSTRPLTRFEPKFLVEGELLGVGTAAGLSSISRLEAGGSFTRFVTPTAGESFATADADTLYFVKEASSACSASVVINPMESATECVKWTRTLSLHTVKRH